MHTELVRYSQFESLGAVVPLKDLVNTIESEAHLKYCLIKYASDCIIDKETAQKYVTVEILEKLLEQQRGIDYLTETFSVGVYEESVAFTLRSKGINCMTYEERYQSYIDISIEIARTSNETDKFGIFVNLGTKSVFLEVFPGYTVAYLKYLVARKAQETVVHRLIYQGKEMENHESLEFYGISPEATIFSVSHLGGTPKGYYRLCK
jgi:Ubiquitin family